jgi:hypothetical protein
VNYLPRVASNCDPPDLCLGSKHEPLVPSFSLLLKEKDTSLLLGVLVGSYKRFEVGHET